MAATTVNHSFLLDCTSRVLQFAQVFNSDESPKLIGGKPCSKIVSNFEGNGASVQIKIAKINKSWEKNVSYNWSGKISKLIAAGDEVKPEYYADLEIHKFTSVTFPSGETHSRVAGVITVNSDWVKHWNNEVCSRRLSNNIDFFARYYYEGKGHASYSVTRAPMGENECNVITSCSYVKENNVEYIDNQSGSQLLGGSLQNGYIIGKENNEAVLHYDDSGNLITQTGDYYNTIARTEGAVMKLVIYMRITDVNGKVYVYDFDELTMNSTWQSGVEYGDITITKVNPIVYKTDGSLIGEWEYFPAGGGYADDVNVYYRQYENGYLGNERTIRITLSSRVTVPSLYSTETKNPTLVTKADGNPLTRHISFTSHGFTATDDAMFYQAANSITNRVIEDSLFTLSVGSTAVDEPGENEATHTFNYVESYLTVVPHVQRREKQTFTSGSEAYTDYKDTVLTYAECNASSNSAWLTVSQDADGYFRVEAPANSGDERSGVVTISYKTAALDTLTATLTITQSAQSTSGGDTPPVEEMPVEIVRKVGTEITIKNTSVSKDYNGVRFLIEIPSLDLSKTTIQTYDLACNATMKLDLCDGVFADKYYDDISDTDKSDINISATL